MNSSNSSAVYIGLGVAFIIWVLCLAWTISIARKKGRSTFGWGVLAFFFSWIALIVILLMPSRRTV